MSGVALSLSPDVLPSVRRRALGALVDLALMGCAFGIFALVASVLVPLNDSRGKENPGAAAIGGVMILLALLGPMLGHAWSIRRRGATPGQRLMKIRTVSLAGDGTVAWSDAIRRGFGWEIGAAALGTGLWVAYRDALARGWHDKLANTVVVEADYAPTLTAFVKEHEPATRSPAPAPVLTRMPTPSAPVNARSTVLPVISPAELTVPLLVRHHWTEGAAVLRLVPDEAEAVDWLGMCLALSRTPKALVWLNEYAVREPSPAIQVARSLKLVIEDHLDEAETVLAGVPAQAHALFRPLAEAAVARAATRDADAEALVSAFVAGGGDEFLAATVQASAANTAGDSAQGMRFRRQAIALAPWDTRELAIAVTDACHPKKRIREGAAHEVDAAQVAAWTEQIVANSPDSGLTQQAARFFVARKGLGAPIPDSVRIYAQYLQVHRDRQRAAERGRRVSSQPIEPPPGTVWADGTRCRCGTLEILRGFTATHYAAEHLVIVGTVENLDAVLARCPNGVASWFGLSGSEPEGLGDPTLVRIPELVVQSAVPNERTSGGYL